MTTEDNTGHIAHFSWTTGGGASITELLNVHTGETLKLTGEIGNLVERLVYQSSVQAKQLIEAREAYSRRNRQHKRELKLAEAQGKVKATKKLLRQIRNGEVPGQRLKMGATVHWVHSTDDLENFIMLEHITNVAKRDEAQEKIPF